MSGIHEEGLIRKGSAEEIVVKRDSVMRMYQSAIEQFQKAQEMQKELACSDYAYVSFQIDRHHWLPDSEGSYVRKLVDKSVWTYLLDAMGFRSLMDEKALKRMGERPGESSGSNAGEHLWHARIFECAEAWDISARDRERVPQAIS